MKNSTRSTIYNILTGKAPVSEEEKLAVIREIEDEMAKEANAKATKNSEYETAWELIHEVLVSTKSPLTIAEIYEEVKENLPADFAKGKVQYGMTHQWAEEVVKIEGKPNTYRLK